MNTLIESQVFFFISSVGFVFLWLLTAIFLLYLILITKTFYQLIKKLEKNLDKIGDTTKEMIEDVRDSTVFHLLFGKKKKHK